MGLKVVMGIAHGQSTSKSQNEDENLCHPTGWPAAPPGDLSQYLLLLMPLLNHVGALVVAAACDTTSLFGVW